MGKSTINFVVDEDFLDILNRERDRISEETGCKISRNSVVISLIKKGLKNSLTKESNAV